MTKLTLVGISGSLRRASTNSLLVHEAAQRFGADTFIFANIRFPLFDGDLQEAEGIPDVVETLRRQIAEADAIVISTPEYNKGISGVLKNALDWISVTDENPWVDKPVALVSAAAGRAGGERAQNMARLAVTPFQPRLLTGPEVMIAETADQWDDMGRLTNNRSARSLDRLMTELRKEALRMHGG